MRLHTQDRRNAARKMAPARHARRVEAPGPHISGAHRHGIRNVTAALVGRNQHMADTAEPGRLRRHIMAVDILLSLPHPVRMKPQHTQIRSIR